MNPVLMLTRNNLELTKRAVESVMKQDIGVALFVVDNGSTDDTVEWLQKQYFIGVRHYETNEGVSAGWNDGLQFLFPQHSHCLVINNDVILSPWTYRYLLSYNVPFVSGVSVGKLEEIAMIPLKPASQLSQHPDFSCFLIRKECCEKVGVFDANMKHYASDLDFHIRAHRKGVRLYGANVPFYHERSSTLKHAIPEERAEIERQANQDRAYLKQKWGVGAWSHEYDRMFTDELFGIDSQEALR